MVFFFFLLLLGLCCACDRRSPTASCSPYQRDRRWRRATAPARCSTPACCTTSRRWPTRSSSSRRSSPQVRRRCMATRSHTRTHTYTYTSGKQKGQLQFCKARTQQQQEVVGGLAWSDMAQCAELMFFFFCSLSTRNKTENRSRKRGKVAKKNVEFFFFFNKKMPLRLSPYLPPCSNCLTSHHPSLLRSPHSCL